MMVPDAIRLAKALEPLNLMWLEDMITGDYTPYLLADLYRQVTQKQTVNIVGPDPADVGGIAELKWVAEYADLHGILIAPHGVIDGLIGLAAHVQVAATLPQNYIALEYPGANPDWWYRIVTGLPNPIVENGFIEVWDKPGLGVELVEEEAHRHLADGDEAFFD